MRGRRIREVSRPGCESPKICLGGLGSVHLTTDAALPRWPWTIAVSSSQPGDRVPRQPICRLEPCARREAERRFFALGSGPARALARKEPLFAELGYRGQAQDAVLVLESGKPPPRR